MAEKIIISRKWHRPEITAQISEDGLLLSINVDDFIEAVLQEIGSVTWVFQDKTFKNRLDLAVNAVFLEIKKSSLQAM